VFAAGGIRAAAAAGHCGALPAATATACSLYFILQPVLYRISPAACTLSHVLFRISNMMLRHQSAAEGGEYHAPAEPDESLEDQRDFASLLQQVSIYFTHYLHISMDLHVYNVRIMPVSSRDIALAAPCRAISARRIRGQVYHIHRVGSPLSFRIAIPSMVPLTALQLLEHRRRIARSSACSLGNSETAGRVSFQCTGWPPEVELFTFISIELCCSCPQPQ
jgi:hypothetical protein